MKSVLEYLDYRAYMADVFAFRKANGGFTWREFAKIAGYASPVYLQLVTQGKSNLSTLGIERVAVALDLRGKDVQYFRLLVQFNQEKDSTVQKSLLAGLRGIAESCHVALIDSAKFDYYQDWIHPALRELAPARPGASAAELARMLRPSATPAKVRKALELLESLELLVRDSNGNWQQTDRSISTGTAVSSLAVREMHRQMGNLAVESLESVPVSHRDISGLTIGISDSGFVRLQEELAAFRRRVVEIVRDDAQVDQVYRLNLQLFPLTACDNEGGRS